jgi:UDP-2,4-diacetamido-2,4,6-trideoxy-beta-L-altropyranose hydrolase
MSLTCVFRADADSEIGSGHFMRSLSVAAEWRKRGHRAVIVGNAPEELIRRAGGLDVEHLAFMTAGSLYDDSRGLIEHCSDVAAQIVCIDGYKFDPTYVGRVRSSDFSLIEFADGPIWSGYQSDLLLDQNLGGEQHNYGTAIWTRQLLGVKYACLAPQFLDHVEVVRSTKERVANVLVSMGGADPKDATTIVLSAVFELGSSVQVTVTIGASHPRKNAISELVRCHSNVNMLVDAQNMAELMLGADVAVAAAGSISWELAALGVPALLMTVADNQLRIAAQLDRAGAAMSVGAIADVTSNGLAQKLKELINDHQLRSEMSCMGQELVDGQGVVRVVDEILELARRRPAGLGT